MEVKIGIQSVPRELIVDTDATAAEIERDLAAALAAADGASIFSLATQKGGRVLIPADKIAFIEFSGDQARRVGFGNIVLPLANGLAAAPLATPDASGTVGNDWETGMPSSQSTLT